MTLLQGLRPRLMFIGSLLAAVLVFGATASIAAGPVPTGRVVIAWHVTISPAWFDPSTAPPQITPFGMLYAIHDALVRPYPGQKMGPSLAESGRRARTA
jgi:peptide/nickel transport system substrate-binding protein